MGKRYKCPYCELRDERKKLIIHIDKRHEEMLPEGYDGARIMYDKINHTDGHGNCRVCKKPTPWNYKAQRYDTLCSNPKCKEAMREEYKKNMLRVRGTYNILNDPQQQEKMLANRSISGKYKFRDGGIVTYTGSYEEKFLEFIDNVMEISSKDILMPGPTIEYWYKGEKHFYITDCLYIPFNAIIEIKDGGNNPNNKSTPGMIASREKTVQKEKIITDRGEYNYIRLTNNEFTQLIEFFMEIKEKMLNDDPSMTVRIHETSASSELDNGVIEESYLEESSNNKLYFISEKQDLKKLEPRIPNNFFTKNGYEDSKTPRVCFSTDIGKCLSALSMNCADHEYYVYSPAKDYKVITPTQKQVPDVKITDEKWITEPVELICIGKILCSGDDGKDGMPFKYGNNTAELYGWKWKWIEKHNINESVLLESVKEIRYIDYRSNEAKKYIESDSFLKRTYRNSQNEYNGEIAVDGDNVVGYIFIGDKTDKGFINSLVVYSKYRKHGIATRLLNDAISKYGGYDLTVKKNNKIAIEMYKNKGFVFVGDGNSSSEYYMKLKSHLSNDEKKMILDESYLLEDSIDSINKAFVDDFKKYINENPKGYNKEIKPLGTPITYTAKKKNEKWLLLATYNGKLNKKTSSSFLPQLQKNVKYNGENIEYHTCYLPGDIYIFIKLPNGGR